MERLERDRGGGEESERGEGKQRRGTFTGRCRHSKNFHEVAQNPAGTNFPFFLFIGSTAQECRKRMR